MTLSDSLLAWLPRFFNRDPMPFIAMRVKNGGDYTDTPLTWLANNRTLTLIRQEEGAPPTTFTYDLAAYTVSSLAAAISADGFTVLLEASPDQGVLSALILMDGEGDTSASNGDALFAWTSLLFAYLQPMAAELDEAGDQIVNMLLQMETQTAEKEWLDFIGSYYAVPRIHAPCSNLLSFSNDLSQAPSPWEFGGATATRTAGGTWLLRGTAGLTSHYVRQTIALDTPYTYTATWRVRPAGYTAFRAKISDGGDTNFASANFDMLAGTAAASDGGTGLTYEATITPQDDGWFLCRITGLPAAIGTALRLAIYVTDPSFTETFAADPLLGIEMEKLQLERGSQPTPYTASGTLTPEQDRTYGKRIITEVFRPRGNNVAIAANVEEVTGQATTITDVTTYGPIAPNYNATYTHNAAIVHDSAATPIYGLFDAETSYDLLGAEPPALYIARLREVVGRLRDAGTHLRAVTLGNGAIEDSAPPPLSDAITGLAMTPALDDTAPAPGELAGEPIADAALSALTDQTPGWDDTDGMTLTINYNIFYNSLRSHNGAVAHQGGASPGEVL